VSRGGQLDLRWCCVKDVLLRKDLRSMLATREEHRLTHVSAGSLADAGPVGRLRLRSQQRSADDDPEQDHLRGGVTVLGRLPDAAFLGCARGPPGSAARRPSLD
jgi:hypothetical protein